MTISIAKTTEIIDKAVLLTGLRRLEPTPEPTPDQKAGVYEKKVGVYEKKVGVYKQKAGGYEKKAPGFGQKGGPSLS